VTTAALVRGDEILRGPGEGVAGEGQGQGGGSEDEGELRHVGFLRGGSIGFLTWVSLAQLREAQGHN